MVEHRGASLPFKLAIMNGIQDNSVVQDKIFEGEIFAVLHSIGNLPMNYGLVNHAANISYKYIYV